MTSARPMTPEEKYFTFLDQTWPMNSMLVAELDVSLPIEHVEKVWKQFNDARSYPRTVVDPDLTLRDVGPGHYEFSAEVLPSDQWQSRIHAETTTRYPLGMPLRLRYLTSPEEKRSWLYIVGHHAILDGRVGDVQVLLRGLDGQEIPEQQELSRPYPPRSFPWREDRKELINLLRSIREQQEAVGEVEPADWPASTPERDVTTHRIMFEGDTPAALMAGMKSRGVRPLPAVCAVWLSAVQHEFGGDDPMTLQLATAIDLVTQAPDPDLLKPMTVGVVANRFRVEPGATWELAKQVNTALGTSVMRGEGDLFVELSRVGAIDDLDRGRELVAQGVASAPPTVAVTNLGVVDPGSDPEWVRAMCPYLGPTPNHVAFVTGITYRGHMAQSVSFDALRVPPARAQRVLEHVHRQMAELAVTP